MINFTCESLATPTPEPISYTAVYEKTSIDSLIEASDGLVLLVEEGVTEIDYFEDIHKHPISIEYDFYIEKGPHELIGVFGSVKED